MEFKDYYKIMGVARDASADDIKRAYRKLARRYHPDVSKEKDAEAKFKEVQEAYAVLKDPEKRAAYDQLGPNWKAGEQFRPPPDWGGEFQFSFGGEDGGGFSDFFESLFGGRGGFGRAGTGRGGFRAPRQDRHARLEIDLEEAFRGGVRNLRLEQPQVTADGQVLMQEREIRVSIPAGVRDGQQIRLRGQGGGNGEDAVDLYLEITIRAHPLYQLDGRNVSLTLPVAPWEAALGATVPVPTLGGAVELKVPAGARAGQRLRLKARGLPGNPPGDQFVVLRIVLPPGDSPRARALYEQMQRELSFDPRAELRQYTRRTE